MGGMLSGAEESIESYRYVYMSYVYVKDPEVNEANSPPFAHIEPYLVLPYRARFVSRSNHVLPGKDWVYLY